MALDLNSCRGDISDLQQMIEVFYVKISFIFSIKICINSITKCATMLNQIDAMVDKIDICTKKHYRNNL